MSAASVSKIDISLKQRFNIKVDILGMINQVDEIKSKLDVVQTLGDYIQLKKAGMSYRAVCPFHKEKTPSFFVSPEKQIWHCFGCGAGGDIFEFVQKLEGVEFPEALKILAEKAGVKLETSAFARENETRANRLKEIIDAATEFYHKHLFTEEGKEAREYLKKRGLDKDTVIEFKLGLAPNSWDTILNHFKKAKFTEMEIEATGLLVRRESKVGHPAQGGPALGWYDRFRNRIMFPIKDSYSNVVGFTSRILPSAENDPKAGGKYVNTPQTALYDKSRVLYGLEKAKNFIKEKSFAIIVEGNMDVITCHQFGFKNTVASSGTALTESQLDLLKRFTANIYLSFDADEAGEIAAKRGIDIALEKSFNIKIIQIPDGCGKDPDDCIRKDKEAWKKAVTEAKDVMDYYFDKYLFSKKSLSLDEKSKSVHALLTEIAKLPEAVRQSHWMHVLGNATNVKEDILFDELKRVKTSLKTKKIEHNETAEFGKNNRCGLLSERLLALGLYAPQKFEFIISKISGEVMSPEYEPLYRQFVEYYNSNKTLDFFGLKAVINENDAGGAKNFNKIALFGEKEFNFFDAKELDKEIIKTADELRQCFVLNKRAILEESIKKAEKAGDKELSKQLFDEFNTLIG